MSKRRFYSIIFFMFFVLFACKPKTELYLERGLDILSNVKQMDFNIYKNISIKELGVIRDQKEGTKTLVFKLDNSVEDEDFDNIIIGIRVWILDNKKNIREENWDFEPQIVQIKDYKYILKEIKIKEDRIKKMKIYAYQNIDGKMYKRGSSILLDKIYTYND